MKKSDNDRRFTLGFWLNGRSGRLVRSAGRAERDLQDDSRNGIELSYLAADSGEEDPYETLCCLKWGAHYGMITEAAYEAGKADLLTRL